MFTIAAILLFLFGIVTFLAPVLPSVAATDATGMFLAMILGAALVSFGFIAWQVRNAEASKTRDSLVLGYTLFFVLWAAISLYGMSLDMPNANMSWLPALLQALVAAGFFMAGRAGMTKARA